MAEPGVEHQDGELRQVLCTLRNGEQVLLTIWPEQGWQVEVEFREHIGAPWAPLYVQGHVQLKRYNGATAVPWEEEDNA